MANSETTGRLLLEAVRVAVRKNKLLVAEVDQLKQRIKILEDQMKNIAPGT